MYIERKWKRKKTVRKQKTVDKSSKFDQQQLFKNRKETVRT